jgi:hypothetical protein
METYRSTVMLTRKCIQPSIHNSWNVPETLSRAVVEPWGHTDAYLNAGSLFWYSF